MAPRNPLDGVPGVWGGQLKNPLGAPLNLNDATPQLQPDLPNVMTGGNIWRLQPTPLVPDSPAATYQPAPPTSGFIEIPVLRNGEAPKEGDKRTYGPDDWRTQVYNKAAPAVNRITISDASGERGAATGFFVSADGLIATDNHVPEHGSKLSVQLPDGRTYSAHVVKNNSADDLALIQIDKKNADEKFPYLPLAKPDSKLSAEDSVVMVGHPLGWNKEYLSEGSYSKTQLGVETDGRRDGRNPYRHLLEFNMHGEPGNSGSPILNKSGEVVGILDGSYPSDPNRSTANPVSDLRKMMPGNKEQEQTSLRDYVVPSSLHFGHSDLVLGALTGLQTFDAGYALKTGVTGKFTPSAVMGGLAAFDAYYDAPNFYNSVRNGTTAEAVSAGIDFAGDAMMIGGAVGNFIPQYRTLAATIQLAGAGLRLGNSILGDRKY